MVLHPTLTLLSRGHLTTYSCGAASETNSPVALAAEYLCRFVGPGCSRSKALIFSVLRASLEIRLL